MKLVFPNLTALFLDFFSSVGPLIAMFLDLALTNQSQTVILISSLTTFSKHRLLLAFPTRYDEKI
jgi:hypothetical protein